MYCPETAQYECHCTNKLQSTGRTKFYEDNIHEPPVRDTSKNPKPFERNFDNRQSFDQFPPPEPPNGDYSQWELQFCKWWGWTWVRKGDKEAVRHPQERNVDIVRSSGQMRAEPIAQTSSPAPFPAEPRIRSESRMLTYTQQSEQRFSPRERGDTRKNSFWNCFRRHGDRTNRRPRSNRPAAVAVTPNYYNQPRTMESQNEIKPVFMRSFSPEEAIVTQASATQRIPRTTDVQRRSVQPKIQTEFYHDNNEVEICCCPCHQICKCHNQVCCCCCSCVDAEMQDCKQCKTAETQTHREVKEQATKVSETYVSVQKAQQKQPQEVLLAKPNLRFCKRCQKRCCMRTVACCPCMKNACPCVGNNCCPCVQKDRVSEDKQDSSLKERREEKPSENQSSSERHRTSLTIDITPRTNDNVINYCLTKNLPKSKVSDLGKFKSDNFSTLHKTLDILLKNNINIMNLVSDKKELKNEAKTPNFLDLNHNISCLSIGDNTKKLDPEHGNLLTAVCEAILSSHKFDNDQCNPLKNTGSSSTDKTSDFKGSQKSSNICSYKRGIISEILYDLNFARNRSDDTVNFQREIGVQVNNSTKKIERLYTRKPCFKVTRSKNRIFTSHPKRLDTSRVNLDILKSGCNTVRNFGRNVPKANLKGEEFRSTDSVNGGNDLVSAIPQFNFTQYSFITSTTPPKENITDCHTLDDLLASYDFNINNAEGNNENADMLQSCQNDNLLDITSPPFYYDFGFNAEEKKQSDSSNDGK